MLRSSRDDGQKNAQPRANTESILEQIHKKLDALHGGSERNLSLQRKYSSEAKETNIQEVIEKMLEEKLKKILEDVLSQHQNAERSYPLQADDDVLKENKQIWNKERRNPREEDRARSREKKVRNGSHILICEDSYADRSLCDVVDVRESVQESKSYKNKKRMITFKPDTARFEADMRDSIAFSAKDLRDSQLALSIDLDRKSQESYTLSKDIVKHMIELGVTFANGITKIMCKFNRQSTIQSTVSNFCLQRIPVLKQLDSLPNHSTMLLQQLSARELASISKSSFLIL